MNSSFSLKVLTFFSVVYVIGMPIYTWFGASTLLISSIFIIFGKVNISFKKISITLCILIAFTLIKISLPVLSIHEGHNVFIAEGEDSVFSQQMPKPVFEYFQNVFNKNISEEKWCDKTIYGCWRHFPRPSKLFEWSADSVFQNSKYSRIVNEISIDSIQNARLGFVNSLGPRLNLNWINEISDITRPKLPYFLMYEFSEQAVGSELCWKGYGVIQKISNGNMNDNIYSIENHINKDCLELTQDYIGARFWGLSLPDSGLSVDLKPSIKLRLIGFFQKLISLFSIIGMLYLLISIENKKRFLIVLGIVLISGFIVAKGMEFNAYSIFNGGNDPLTYWGWGREILQNLLAGNYYLALRGEESAYYFMPGFRYLNAVGMILFGDSQYLFWILVTLVPAILFQILRLYRPELFAIFFTLIFILNSSSGWSLSSFIGIIWGHAEVGGYFFALLGIYLILKYLNQAKIDCDIDKLFFGGFFLAISVFIRPNLIISCILAISMSFLILNKSGRWKQFCGLFLGFGTIILVPIHNLIFAQKFVLLTTAASIPENYITPINIYFYAIKEWFSGSLGEAYQRIGIQLVGWIDSKIKLALVAILLLLCLFNYFLSPRLRVLLAFVLGLHIPLLFFLQFPRFSVLTWCMTYLILIICLPDIYKRILIIAKKINKRFDKWIY